MNVAEAGRAVVVGLGECECESWRLWELENAKCEFCGAKAEVWLANMDSTAPTMDRERTILFLRL